MLSLEQCRKLDSETSNLSDEELVKLRGEIYDMGQLMFDSWLQQIGGSKYPVAVLQKLREVNIITSWKQEQKME